MEKEKYVDEGGLYLPYSASSFANFFIGLYDEDKDPVLNCIRINQLCYLAFGWIVGITERYAFKNRVKAWDYFPVIPSLYYEFKQYGDKAIPKDRKSVGSKYSPSGKLEIFMPAEIKEQNEDRVFNLSSRVYDVYRKYSNEEIIKMNNSKGTPWYIVFDNDKRDITIDGYLIQEYFKNMVVDDKNIC